MTNELNNKILQVSSILEGKYHFHIVENWDNVNDQELIVSLIQSRVLAEGICRYVLLYEGIAKSESAIDKSSTLNNYLHQLNFALTTEIKGCLSQIQSASNSVAHFQVDGLVNQDYARMCIDALEQVVNWFLLNYKDTVIDKYKKIDSGLFSSNGELPRKVAGCVVPTDDSVNSIKKI